MSGLQRLEHHGRRADGEDQGHRGRQTRQCGRTPSPGRYPGAGRGPVRDKDRRARPRARRRHRGRLGRPDRRRPRHRQVHARPADAPAGVGAPGQGAVRVGRGIACADQDARDPARRQDRQSLRAGRDAARGDHPRFRRARAPGPGRGFGPDRVHLGASVRAGQRGPGARGLRQAHAPRQAHGRSRRS